MTDLFSRLQCYLENSENKTAAKITRFTVYIYIDDYNYTDCASHFFIAESKINLKLVTGI